MKNKTLALFSVLLFSFSLFGCSKKTENPNSSSDISQSGTDIVIPSETNPISEEPPVTPTTEFFSVVFDAQNESEPTVYTVEKNSKISELPNEPTKKNYSFLGWYESGIKFNFDTTITENHYLMAKWKLVSYDMSNYEEPVSHSITNDNGETKYNIYFIIGNNQSNFDIDYTYNTETDLISFETFDIANYTFDGWFLDANMINEPFNNTNTTLASLNKDTIYLYAKFVEDTPALPIEEQCVHQIETRILQQGSCKTGTKTIEQTYCVKCGKTYDTIEYTVYHEMTDKSECEYFAPTCTEKGYYIQKCKNCDYQLQYIYADEIEHNLVNQVVLEPTCTASGYSADVCTMCGTEFNRVTIEPTGHNYYVIGTIPSTCSTNGYELYQCRCGNTKEGDKLPLDENNHVYDENGVCYLCGHQKEE